MAAMITDADMNAGVQLWLKQIASQAGIPSWAVEFHVGVHQNAARWQKEMHIQVTCLVLQAGVADMRFTQVIEEIEFHRGLSYDDTMLQWMEFTLQQVKPHLIMMAFCIKGALRREENNVG